MTRHAEPNINILLIKDIFDTDIRQWRHLYLYYCIVCVPKDMACEENKEDDVIPIITIAGILVIAPFEEVSEVITEDDE